MAILQTNKEIKTYEVRLLIKEVHNCEVYRMEEEKEESSFLKVDILSNVPGRMLKLYNL